MKEKSLPRGAVSDTQLTWPLPLELVHMILDHADHESIATVHAMASLVNETYPCQGGLDQRRE